MPDSAQYEGLTQPHTLQGLSQPHTLPTLPIQHLQPARTIRQPPGTQLREDTLITARAERAGHQIGIFCKRYQIRISSCPAILALSLTARPPLRKPVARRRRRRGRRRGELQKTFEMPILESTPASVLVSLVSR